eukprot:847912_1
MRRNSLRGITKRFYMEYSQTGDDYSVVPEPPIRFKPWNKIECQPSYSLAGQRFDLYISSMQQSHPKLMSFQECESPVFCNISLTCDVLNPNSDDPNERFKKDSSTAMLRRNPKKGYTLLIVKKSSGRSMPVTDSTTCYSV